jgi:CHAT domain-containing protein
MSEVIKWKTEYLDTAKGRDQSLETDNSEESPFRELDFLVRPLAQASQDGDLFVFSVSGAMHSIPIHALWIRDEVPIIDVNPVTYCANLTSFTQCWRRAHNRNTEDSLKTMIAVYEPTPGVPFQKKEQEAVYSSIHSLATTARANSLTGPQVSQASFRQAFESSSLLHFHGHGLFAATAITEQSLLLNPPSPPFSVQQFFDLNLRSPHVTLIACDSASQSITAGDEPLGVVTAILCAGASSVIGTLWPISSGSGRLFSKFFYEEVERMGEGERWIDLALAVREAVLEIKGRPRTRLPYFWASFVLHGAGVYKLEKGVQGGSKSFS